MRECLRDRTTSNQNTMINLFPPLVDSHWVVHTWCCQPRHGWLCLVHWAQSWSESQGPPTKSWWWPAINCDGNVVLCEVGVQDVAGDRGCPVWEGLESWRDGCIHVREVHIYYHRLQALFRLSGVLTWRHYLQIIAVGYHPAWAHYCFVEKRMAALGC